MCSDFTTCPFRNRPKMTQLPDNHDEWYNSLGAAMITCVQLCNHYHIPDLLTLHESWLIYDASFCLFVLRQIISKRLPQQQLNTLIFVLFEGLVDSQSNCSRASSVILNTLLKNRGAMLQDLVMILTGYIKTASLKCFPSVSCVNECKELLCSSLLISLHVCVSGARDVGGTAHSVTGHL